LDKIFNVNPGNPPQDATIVTGPNGKGEAIQYGPNTPIIATGKQPTYLINALSTSDDLTYFTWFRMAKALQKGDRWIFFSLQDEQGQKTYTSIGLKTKSSGGQGAENTGTNTG